MIQIETYTISGRDFIRTYSDSGRYVVREGVEYSEACDPAEFGRTYTEGELIPEEGNEEATSVDYDAALERLVVTLQ